MERMSSVGVPPSPRSSTAGGVESGLGEPRSSAESSAMAFADHEIQAEDVEHIKARLAVCAGDDSGAASDGGKAGGEDGDDGAADGDEAAAETDAEKQSPPPPPAVELLDLSKAAISEDALLEILQAVAKNATLATLSLAGIMLSAEAHQLILSIALNHPTLSSLKSVQQNNLSHCTVSNENAQALRDAVSARQSGRLAINLEGTLVDEAIKEDIHAIFAGVQLGAEDDDGAAHSQLAAPPGVDANAEVFEITDFTTASPWERFIADLEKAIREYPRIVAEADVSPTSGRILIQDVSLRGRTYNLFYVPDCVAADQPEVSISRELDRLLAGSNFDGGIPKVMAEMLSTRRDFHPRCSNKQWWYGIGAFLTLHPSRSEYSSKVHPSESKLLLSSLSIALANTGCPLPVFVQVHEEQRELAIGFHAQPGCSVSFDVAALPSPPPSLRHLSGLLRLFKSKLGQAGSSARVSVTARFTYTMRNWFDDWLTGESSGFAAAKRRSSKTAAGARFYETAPALPVGLDADPVRSIQLSTIWPNFREDTVLDNAVYSELDPATAPSWSLRAEWHSPSPVGRLGLWAELLSQVTRSMNAYDGMLGDLLGDAAFADDDVLGGPAQPTGRDALHALTSGSARSLMSRRFGSRLGLMVDKTVQRVDRTVKKTVATVTSQTVSSVAALKNGPLPTEDDLDDILQNMFVATEDYAFAQQSGELRRSHEQHGLPRCKSAPHGSLLTELGKYVALVHQRNGGRYGVAVLWNEFVLEVRWHWKNLKLLPRVEVEDGCPDMRHCMLFQKLQMINCCIQRQRGRNAAVAEGDPKSPPGTAGSKSSGGAAGAERAASRRAGSPQSPDRDSDGDEFYLAPEDEEGAMQRLAALKEAESKGAPRTDAVEEVKEDTWSSGEAQTAEGVAEVHPSLRLLKTKAPLNVPVTQDPGPMTEDMMLLQQEAMTSMGASEEASQARTKMQSLMLRSDMEAFKAANPGCILADFVRWHSPRDWIVDDEGDGEGDDGLGGHLSDRMRQEGNIWMELWQGAQPRAACRQRALFDTTAEAEKAMLYLESLSARELMRQLFPSLLALVHESIEQETTPASAVPAGEQLAQLRERAAGYGNAPREDMAHQQELIDVVAHTEALLARCQSIGRKLGDGQEALVGALSSEQDALVLEEAHRDVVLGLFADPDTGVLVEPEVREFVFRTVCAQPSPASRVVAHRMYGMLKEDDFRVAGAFSADSDFI